MILKNLDSGGTTNMLCSDSPRKFGFLSEVLYLDSNGELVSDFPPGGGFLAILAVLRALFGVF